MLKLRCTPFNFLVWNLLSRNREKKKKRKKTKTFDLNLLKPSAYKEMLLKRDQSGREKLRRTSALPHQSPTGGKTLLGELEEVDTICLG